MLNLYLCETSTYVTKAHQVILAENELDPSCLNCEEQPQDTSDSGQGLHIYRIRCCSNSKQGGWEGKRCLRDHCVGRCTANGAKSWCGGSPQNLVLGCNRHRQLYTGSLLLCLRSRRAGWWAYGRIVQPADCSGPVKLQRPSRASLDRNWVYNVLALLCEEWLRSRWFRDNRICLQLKIRR